MRLTVMERKSITKAFAEEYRKARKSRKAELLDEFIKLIGYNRKYAATLLRTYFNRKRKRKKYKRKPYYDKSVKDVLKKIWVIMDFSCGQRLAPILPEIIDRLEHFGEISIDKQTRKKLSKISSSTIDRLLTTEKIMRGRKGRSHTKPGNFLKRQIPIRTYGEWPEKEPGYIEVDLVSHEGGDNSGSYSQSLIGTDISSSWTLSFVLAGKGENDTLGGLKKLKKALPFKLKGLDSDNGSEFINYVVLEFCDENNIKFTRCRPYKKNDNCHVEQKNYSVVRRNVGYLRYDTEKEMEIIQDLYDTLNLYNNFFQPVKKLKLKRREGSKNIRKYDTAKTPYQRILDCKDLSKHVKLKLRKQYLKLNPAELKRKINSLQDKLIEIARKKPETLERYLDKDDKYKLKKYKKRNKPSKRNPSIFVEKQNMDRLIEAVELLREE
jgi:glutaredoxin